MPKRGKEKPSSQTRSEVNILTTLPIIPFNSLARPAHALEYHVPRAVEFPHPNVCRFPLESHMTLHSTLEAPGMRCGPVEHAELLQGNPSIIPSGPREHPATGSTQSLFWGGSFQPHTWALGDAGMQLFSAALPKAVVGQDHSHQLQQKTNPSAVPFEYPACSTEEVAA